MGYLSTGSVITIDAILTKRGRELIAKGDGSFKITQFAVADDEIDYTLSESVIEETPIFEAFPDERYVVKHKLITANRGITKIPMLDLGFEAFNLPAGVTRNIAPKTLNFPSATNNVEPSGYSMTISNVSILSDFKGIGLKTVRLEPTDYEVDSSETKIGTSFSLKGTLTGFGTEDSLSGTLTVIGRDSGARKSIPIVVSKAQISTS